MSFCLCLSQAFLVGCLNLCNKHDPGLAVLQQINSNLHSEAPLPAGGSSLANFKHKQRPTATSKHLGCAGQLQPAARLAVRANQPTASNRTRASRGSYHQAAASCRAKLLYQHIQNNIEIKTRSSHQPAAISKPSQQQFIVVIEPHYCPHIATTYIVHDLKYILPTCAPTSKNSYQCEVCNHPAACWRSLLDETAQPLFRRQI